MRKALDISFDKEPTLRQLMPARFQRHIKNPADGSDLVYEKFTYERIIVMPYGEIFTLIREGKIDIKQTQFISSVKGRYISDEEVEDILSRIEHEIVRDEYKAHRNEVKKLETQYGKSLWIKDPYLPFRCPWMCSNVGQKTHREFEIAEQLLYRLDKKTRFIDIYNFLDSKIVTTGDNLFPDKWVINGREKPYAILKVNSDFYDRAARKLSIGNKPITQITI